MLYFEVFKKMTQKSMMVTSNSEGLKMMSDVLKMMMSYSEVLN